MQTSVGFRTKKESEEQQMYKIIQLLQPARIMIHRMDRHWFFFISASWDIMRVKDHAYSYRLLVRNN